MRERSKGSDKTAGRLARWQHTIYNYSSSYVIFQRSGERRWVASGECVGKSTLRFVIGRLLEFAPKFIRTSKFFNFETAL